MPGFQKIRAVAGSGLQNSRLTVGVIADTHGHLGAGAIEAMAGVDLILHAGDIDAPPVLEALGTIAPVLAVRGNMDQGSWARQLPIGRPIEAGALVLYALHDLTRLDLDPAAAGIAAVLCGHTHRPLLERRRGVLYLNPGSASLPRDGRPPSIARLCIEGSRLEAEIVTL